MVFPESVKWNLSVFSVRSVVKFILLSWTLGGLWPCGAEEPVGIRWYEVPMEANRIHSRDVVRQMLRAAGSEVELPEGFPDQTIHLHPATVPLTLAVWNSMLNPFGGELSVQNRHVRLRVDLAKLEGRLDEMEAVFLDTVGVARIWTLHHLSAEDAAGPAVVLVHGLDSGMRLFKGTCRVLVDRGYDVYFFEYPNDDRIERNARRLSDALRELPPERRRDLSLVTVSMGGLVSQLMIETPELYVNGVSRLIACVPPFQGSEMAALRGFVEVGDHALDLVFQPEAALDVWGDGMGRAGIDLQPDSLLMEKLDRLERNPEVAYSILAGNRGMIDPAGLRKLKIDLEAERPGNPVAEAARRLALERVEVMLKFQTGQGDGAVNLDSAILDGVTDRVVLPYHHLQFLTGFQAEVEKIPGLDEVLKRLPEP